MPTKQELQTVSTIGRIKDVLDDYPGSRDTLKVAAAICESLGHVCPHKDTILCRQESCDFCTIRLIESGYLAYTLTQAE